MNVWKVILSTLVIFIAGVLTGGLVTTHALRVGQIRPRALNGAGGSANPWQLRNRELLRRMDHELKLTPEQHQHIEALIATSQERTKLLWKPIAPQMNKETQFVRAEIRSELNDEQKKKFDELIKPRQNPDKHHPGSNNIPFTASNPAPEIPIITNAASESP